MRSTLLLKMIIASVMIVCISSFSVPSKRKTPAEPQARPTQRCCIAHCLKDYGWLIHKKTGCHFLYAIGKDQCTIMPADFLTHKEDYTIISINTKQTNPLHQMMLNALSFVCVCQREESWEAESLRIEREPRVIIQHEW